MKSVKLALPKEDMNRLCGILVAQWEINEAYINDGNTEDVDDMNDLIEDNNVINKVLEQLRCK